MSARLIFAAFAIGVIALAIALFTVPTIDPLMNGVSETTNITEGQTEELTDRLHMDIENVSDANSTVNATFLATNTRNTTNTGDVSAGNSTNVTVDGDTIEFRVESVTGSTTADVTANYTPLFGWADGPRAFVENLDLIIVIIMGMLAVALTVVGVREI